MTNGQLEWACFLWRLAMSPAPNHIMNRNAVDGQSSTMCHPHIGLLHSCMEIRGLRAALSPWAGRRDRILSMGMF